MTAGVAYADPVIQSLTDGVQMEIELGAVPRLRAIQKKLKE